jgi:hypothetical protein
LIEGGLKLSYTEKPSRRFTILQDLAKDIASLTESFSLRFAEFDFGSESILGTRVEERTTSM